jgi:hypothetical protein
MLVKVFKKQQTNEQKQPKYPVLRLKLKPFWEKKLSMSGSIPGCHLSFSIYDLKLSVPKIYTLN